MHAEMKHVLSAARGRIHDTPKSTARCVTERAFYRKRNCVFRLNATVPCTKSITLDEHGRQGHCGPVVSAAAEGVLCK
jgi:hypothetical protein